MEKDNLENKLFKDFDKAFKEVNKLAHRAIKDIDTLLKKELGPKGYAKFEAYKTKYGALIAEGKTEEAKQLEKDYKESEQV